MAGDDGRPLVTKTSFRFLQTLYNLGPAPEPNLTIWYSPRLPEAFRRFAAKVAIDTSALQFESDEIMRLICANKEWTKNYQIRKALAENNKTPLPNALRYISTLTEKDLANLAKSKNVSNVISTQARRILLQMQKHR